MSNIHREVGFFDSLTPRFGIDLARRPTATATANAHGAGKLEGALMRTNTRAYVSLLVATGAEANRNGGGMEEGLVLLWTMEKVRSSLPLPALVVVAPPLLVPCLALFLTRRASAAPHSPYTTPY